MSCETYLKKPVNAMLSAAPVGKTSGYRYINTIDQKLYELQADGTWLADEDFVIGSMVSVVGELGNSIRYASYYKAGTAVEVLNPFFNSTNTHNANKIIKWNDRIVVARHDANNACSIICIFPDGTSTVMRSGISGCFVSSMCVDGRGSLWVGYKEFTGKAPSGTLERYAYDDDSHPTPEIFSFAGGHIPSDNISGLCAIGNNVWIITALADEFHISLFDGYNFTDKTADFILDTGLNMVAVTGLEWYHVTADSDGMLMFSMHDSSFGDGSGSGAGDINNLFYYLDGHFHAKTLPTFTNTYLQQFEKIGDTVICIVAASSVAGTEGYVATWGWTNEELIYEVDKAAMLLRSNGVDVISIAKDSSTIDAFQSPWTSSRRLSTWETQIDAILTENDSTRNILDFYASPEEYLFINYKNADTDINTIIKMGMAAKWVSN